MSLRSCCVIVGAFVILIFALSILIPSSYWLTILIELECELSHHCLSCLHIVAMLAHWLPVVPVPECAVRTFVIFYVVDHCSSTETVALANVHARWVLG